MSNTDLAPKIREKLARPKQFRVRFVNDDFTPMDFVTDCLCDVFGQSVEEALAITMQIHRKGEGVVGLYTREIAETKVLQVMTAARACDFPLLCEPVEA